MIIRPTKSNVLLQIMPQPTKTDSGIFLPALGKDLQSQFRCMAIGPKVKTVRPGNVVLANSYCGTGLNVDGHELRLVPEEQLYAVIE